MALVLNTYKDYEMKTIDKQYGIGIAGITGYYASQNNWIRYSYGAQQGDVFFVNPSAANFAGIVLSGGNSIFDYSFRNTIPFQDTVPTDNISNASTELVYNPTLIGKGTNNAYFLQMWCSQNSDTASNYLSFTARLGLYTQTPTEGARTTWLYNLGSYTWKPERSTDIPSNTQFGCVKFYKCTIWETDYYLLAAGISASGQCSPTGNTLLMLIPTAYWEDKEVKPYVGPVTPESAAGFDPPGRDFYNDNIIPRVIIDTNPFGFNEDDGWGTVRFIRQSKGEWVGMIQQIYHGIGSGLGALSQFVDVATFSPTTVRDAEEVSAMTKGILSCRVLPDFGFPLGEKVNESTVCGYPLYKGYSTHKTIGNITDQIVPITFPQTYISRTYNNFLDFEPYTTATLHIPFVGDINIDPSVLYGSVISIEGYVDGFTGLISVDVVLRKNGTEWIYAELQGNCGTEMPIIGAGSTTSQAIGKVASGLGQLASNPVGGVFTMLDGIGKAGKSVPSTVNSNPQMAAYFAQRYCYITINTPLPENPENYAALMGTVVRKEGTVGKYTGYSEFSAVNLNTVTATDAEKQEIERLLKGGVFV